MALIYDGSLPGLFTLLGRHFDQLNTLETIGTVAENGVQDLFSASARVVTDPVYAQRVTERLQHRLGKSALRCFALAFLSEEPGRETDLIAFVRQGLEQGPGFDQRLSDPAVHRIQSLARRTQRERHRLMGLLRFVRLDDGLYLGRIEPRNNVALLLAPHFAKRLSDQEWLIFDTKRNLGIFGHQGTWEVVDDVHLPEELPLHPEEEGFSRLWRGFYDHIAIPERRNLKLRQSFMPRYSWRYLTELMDSK